MRKAVSALHTPIDVGLGGVLLANMLVAWLDGHPEVLPIEEATDESQDPGTSPEQAGLHLFTPVDAQPSAPPSGEHGAAVRTPREGTGTGLDRIPDPHAGSGSGEDRPRTNAAEDPQDPLIRRLHGARRG